MNQYKITRMDFVEDNLVNESAFVQREFWF